MTTNDSIIEDFFNTRFEHRYRAPEELPIGGIPIKENFVDELSLSKFKEVVHQILNINNKQILDILLSEINKTDLELQSWPLEDKIPLEEKLKRKLLKQKIETLLDVFALIYDKQDTKLYKLVAKDINDKGLGLKKVWYVGIVQYFSDDEEDAFVFSSKHEAAKVMDTLPTGSNPTSMWRWQILGE